MIGNRKVVGVCMTKVHDLLRSKLISYLHKETEKYGYKLMVFNSSYDFYYNRGDDIGAACIYDFINFDIVDALIILCTGFYSKSIYESIIDRAIEHGTPVILQDDQHEGCYSVYNRFEESLEKLMNHVIREHGARDTYFIAGYKGNEFSEQRIEIYKKVLKDNALSFHENQVAYGNFWETPTFTVIDELCKREKLPEAIFCANDVMAMAACKRLRMHGFRVPEDVMVTGFDGDEPADFSVPRISTCSANDKGFVDECIQIMHAVFRDNPTERIHYNHYSLRISDSCGCSDKEEIDFRSIAERYQHLCASMIGHESLVFNEIVLHLNSVGIDKNTFYGAISKIIYPGACLALRPSFLMSVVGEQEAYSQWDENLMVISTKDRNAGASEKEVQFAAVDMIPEKELWAQDHSIYIISAVQVGKMVCGYFEDKSYNILEDAQKLNRVLNMIDIMLHMAVSDMRQRFLRFDRSKDATIDAVTELANLHGVSHWFDAFVSNPGNSDKVLSVSIYELPKYKYIYENYGMQDVDETVCMVAEALRIANPGNSFIAHIAEDEFLVVRYYDRGEDVDNQVSRASTIFFDMLEKINRTNGKIYFIEADEGSIQVEAVRGAKLESLIKSATNELYQNKIHKGAHEASKNRIRTSKERYELYNVLVSKNLFLYHFQPIVRADNGEIIAYEALMRTDDSIGFSPLEILSIAEEYQRLYDIERATMFNVMERYKKERESFGGRKVFINCIPGYVLNQKDNKKICEKYSAYISDFVFEITERDTITDEELHAIRSIGNEKGNNLIAIDDYGTGHSNVVNLIKYAPQIVKIDRFLMTDIHKDISKQSVVKGLIEFARLNQIKVLAEGIETEQELRKVVELGVDYIQGFYTGHPTLEPIAEIDEKVKAVFLDMAKGKEEKSI